MAFSNSVVGGTVLLRDAIQSPNYVAGSAGWTINQDGSAEFSNIVIRGGTVVSGVALYYNGAPAAGTLALSIAAAAGTDPYGNAYPKGLGVFGTGGTVTASGGEVRVEGTDDSAVNLLTQGGSATVDLVPPDFPGATWLSGSLFTSLGTSHEPSVVLSSPAEQAHTGQAQVELFGGGPSTTDTSVHLTADEVDVDAFLLVTGDMESQGSVRAVNLRSGTAQTPSPGGAPGQTSVAVAFSPAFPVGSAPHVALTVNSTSTDLNNANIRPAVTAVSRTGFTVNCWRDTNAATNFEYVAYAM